MKKFSTLLFTVLLVLSIGTNSILAQADTVIVPDNIDGDYYGALNKFIGGDTTATGERVNPERVYKLERNKIYYLSGLFSYWGYDLTIIADKPDADNRPAVITTGINEGGGRATGTYIKTGGNLTLKNIYFQTVAPDGNGSTWATVQQAKPGHDFLYEGCFFEGANWTTMATWNSPRKVVIIDSYFRNLGNAGQRWNGVGLNLGGQDVDTVIVRNNTFFNQQSFALQGQYCLGKYVEFTHNTYVNSVQWPIAWLWQVNAKFSDNLFYNAYSYGSSEYERNLQEEDSLYWGVINLGALPPLFTDTLMISEASRKVDINNNNWFYSQTIHDYWNEFDSLSGGPFLNARVQNYMDDDVNWPLMNESNTMNLDPGFINVGDGETRMVQWMKNNRAGLENDNWGYVPGESRFAFQWPFPEVLAYTNTTLLTGADGFPVGDLNWFPDEKARWEDWLVGVKDIKQVSTLPQEFSLEQNYPNPFNPSTNIKFSVPENGLVSLKVYNLLGEVVAELVNDQMTAGTYNIDFNASTLSSGIYFYTISAGKFQATKKMLLLK